MLIGALHKRKDRLVKVEIQEVAGIQSAMEAMRLSFDSHSAQEQMISSKADNGFDTYFAWKDDVELLKALVQRGDSHAKVARMIQVWMDITAPRYWWQEFDTYAVGVTRMSQSSIHTLGKRKLTEDDFSNGIFPEIIDYLNAIQGSDIPRVDKMKIMKKNLPESFLQRRIVNINYQALRHIYFDRVGHKLYEWSIFLNAIENLPFHELITVKAKNPWRKALDPLMPKDFKDWWENSEDDLGNVLASMITRYRYELKETDLPVYDISPQGDNR